MSLANKGMRKKISSFCNLALLSQRDDAYVNFTKNQTGKFSQYISLKYISYQISTMELQNCGNSYLETYSITTIVFTTWTPFL